jgi:hypothetical protein
MGVLMPTLVVAVIIDWTNRSRRCEMAETYTGEVRNGVVVFDPVAPLPDGTKVRVEAVERRQTLAAGPDADPVAGTRAMLLAWAQKAEEIAAPLPRDLAENHDHYAHGKPLE